MKNGVVGGRGGGSEERKEKTRKGMMKSKDEQLKISNNYEA